MNAIALISAKVLRDFPSFTRRRRLLYRSLENGLLHGVYLDSTGYERNSFHIQVFCQPMYVQASDLDFTLGFRLSNGKTWNLEDIDAEREADRIAECMVREGDPFLHMLGNPIGIVEFIVQRFNAPYNLRLHRTRIYSRVKAGEYDKSIAELGDVFELARRISKPRDWEIDLLQELERFGSNLRDDPSVALDCLSRWEVQVREAVGISNDRV